MTPATHVLIDAATSVARDGVIAEGHAGNRKWSVRLRTCRGGKSEGVQVVEVDNGAMTIDVLPTRGMGIWRVRRGDSTLGWRAPAREPVHPMFVPLMEPAGLGWLDGFNELLCRCGLESNGAPEFDDAGRLLRPLHGRIANTPAHRVELIVDEAAGELTLRGVVDETRFHFQSLRLTSSITTIVRSDEFSWDDEVTNIGGRDAVMQMLYHFNVGQPLFQPGARIVAPIETVAPHSAVAAKVGVATWNVMPPPRPASSEQVYLTTLIADAVGNTQILLDGLTGGAAVGLRFNKLALPCFSVWRNSPAEADGYVVGLEPGTNYPNPRTFERKHGRVVELKPGAIWRAAVTAKWHSDRQSIAQAEQAIRDAQTRHEAQLLPERRADWSN